MLINELSRITDHQREFLPVGEGDVTEDHKDQVRSSRCINCKQIYEKGNRVTYAIVFDLEQGHHTLIWWHSWRSCNR